MAVTATWVNAALVGQFSATADRRVDWVTDEIRVTLHTSAVVLDKDVHDFFNDVSASEVAGTGYTAGGIALATKTVTHDAATDEIRLDAADISWPNSTITARYAVIWKQTAGASTTDPLLGLVDFGGDQTTNGTTFAIQWDATGVLKLDTT